VKRYKEHANELGVAVYVCVIESMSVEELQKVLIDQYEQYADYARHHMEYGSNLVKSHTQFGLGYSVTTDVDHAKDLINKKLKPLAEEAFGTCLARGLTDEASKIKDEYWLGEVDANLAIEDAGEALVQTGDYATAEQLITNVRTMDDTIFGAYIKCLMRKDNQSADRIATDRTFTDDQKARAARIAAAARKWNEETGHGDAREKHSSDVRKKYLKEYFEGKYEGKDTNFKAYCFCVEEERYEDALKIAQENGFDKEIIKYTGKLVFLQRKIAEVGSLRPT
jgi:hypothetical protein